MGSPSDWLLRPLGSALAPPRARSVPLVRLLDLSVLYFWYLAFSWVSDSFIYSFIHSTIFVVLLLCARGCARHWGTAENRTA